jgi:hypothetical protein
MAFDHEAERPRVGHRARHDGGIVGRCVRDDDEAMDR